MEKEISHFLQKHLPERPRVLLGLSGGPDSMALFWLLKGAGYPFVVAHVDHGWREESCLEAKNLEEMCLKEQIPFFCTRLTPPSKNLEDEGRNGRLAFFKQVIERENLAGVMLAHQADDVAETVLKRLFEGASLPKLKGLASQTEVNGIVIYRPLLKVRKKEIVGWLTEKEINYFQDPTNQQTKFLRGRMREELMPMLSESFGKEITPALCQIAAAAEELGAFLTEQIAPFTREIRQSEGETALHFGGHLPSSPFLWKATIRHLFDTQHLTLSKSTLETIVVHLQNESCHKVLRVGQQEVRIHRKEITICRKS